MMKALVILSCLVGLALSKPWSDFDGYQGGAYPYSFGFPWGYPYGYPFHGQGYGGGYGQGYGQGYGHGYGYGYGYGQPGGYAPYNRLVFYGEFQGTCDKAQDGIYFVDERSFAYCSGGKKTIQPCAEGSANPPVAHFKHGDYYALYDFCSINLVAKGYKAPGYDSHPPKPHVPGYGDSAPKYEETHEYGYQETSYDQKPKVDYGKPKY